MIKYIKALLAVIKGIRQGIRAAWIQSLGEHKEIARHFVTYDKHTNQIHEYVNQINDHMDRAELIVSSKTFQGGSRWRKR